MPSPAAPRAPPHPVLHRNTRARRMAVLFFLLARQLRGFLAGFAPHLLVRQQNLRHALIPQVRPAGRPRVLPCRRALFVELLVR